jgi:peptidylprolyl isomerase
MRRLALLAAAVPLLFAAACGGSGGGAAKSATPSAAAAGDVKVSGALGSKPQVTIPKGTPPVKSSAKTLQPGTGVAIQEGDEVVVNLTAYSWDGKTNAMAGSTYDDGSPQLIQVGNTLPKIIHTAFQGVKAGGRFLAVVASDSLSAQQLAQAKQQGTDKSASVYVVDVVGTSTVKAAHGTPVKADVKGVQLVNAGGDSPPQLTTKTKEHPPSGLIAKTVIKGTGPKVKSGQALVVQYTGKIWGTDKEFDSSWQKGQPVMFQIGTGKVIKGWDQGLVGVPVGSRLLLSIPPELAYGKQGQGGVIKGTDTLVFVVDVLSAY